MPFIEVIGNRCLIRTIVSARKEKVAVNCYIAADALGKFNQSICWWSSSRAGTGIIVTETFQ